MTSVNQINEAIAKLRNMPSRTVEAYSRTLRRAGILPETKRGSAATPVTCRHAAMMLFAVLRGSPTNAAENATELGGLIWQTRNEVGEDLPTPSLAFLQSLGWPTAATLCDVVAWLIDLYSRDAYRDTIKDVDRWQDPVSISVDLYKPKASMRWRPTIKMAERYRETMRRGAVRDEFDGRFALELELKERGDLVHDYLSVSFGAMTPRRAEELFADFPDWTKTSERLAYHREMSKQFDLNGTEKITEITFFALSELFRADEPVRMNMRGG